MDYIKLKATEELKKKKTETETEWDWFLAENKTPAWKIHKNKKNFQCIPGRVFFFFYEIDNINK